MLSISSSFERKELLYLICAMLFCVIVIVSNIITVKLFSLPFISQPLAVGVVFYPCTFCIGNLVTELFGPAKARFMIYLSFVMMLITCAIIKVALILPPFNLDVQIAFESIFALNGLMLLSSLVAYTISQIVDIQLYTWLKRLTNSEHLWLRICSSTICAQLIDVSIVTIWQLYFGLNLPMEMVLHIVIISYIYKISVSIGLTPLFYAAVAFSNRLLVRRLPNLGTAA